jgi:hypothetical protein
MDRLANPFAPAAGESDPGSPPFVFFLPAMAKATAPDDAFAVLRERPAHRPTRFLATGDACLFHWLVVWATRIIS